VNGPEHYREAERLLVGAQNVMDVAPVDGLTRTECTELAGVHATLALAAAVGGLDWESGSAARWASDEKRWREIVAPEHVKSPPEVTP
jgi:hypothetical protein